MIKSINGLHKKPAAPAAPAEPPPRCALLPDRIPIKAVRCPHCTSSWRASRRSMPDPATPVPEKAAVPSGTAAFAVSVRCGACRRQTPQQPGIQVVHPSRPTAHRTETYTGWWYTSKKAAHDDPQDVQRQDDRRICQRGQQRQRTSLRGRWGSRSSSR